MISNFYPSEKRKKADKHRVVRTYGTPSSTTPNTNVSAYYTALEKEKAEKLKLTVDDYRLRKAAVKAAAESCPFQVGDTVYPYLESLFETHGKLRVDRICRDFDDYGTIAWNNPPFILVLARLDNPNERLNTTVGWCVKRHDLMQKGEAANG